MGLDHPLLGGFVRKEFLGGAEDVTFWEGVFISSIVWAVVCLLAFIRGMEWSFDNRLNWSDGFSSGWDEAMKAIKELSEKKEEAK